MGFDLHGRPPFVPLPLLDLVDWPPCPLDLDLHQKKHMIFTYDPIAFFLVITKAIGTNLVEIPWDETFFWKKH